jgi:histidinol-phosphatase (PHP family)
MASPGPVTWIRKDFHVHERHSSDAPGATVEKYCRIAESRGIDEVAFTTHYIITGPDWEFGLQPDQIAGYLEEIDAAQETTNVVLRRGVEVDYFPGEERRIGAILDEHQWDFILGSLHFVKGIDIGSRLNSPRFFKDRRPAEALDVYFEEFQRAVESGLFDVIAHADYFRKYTSLSYESPVIWEQYGAKVYEALDSLRSNGVGFSVNASGWRHGIGDVYPIEGFARAAFEAGVDMVTIGSDCHTVYDLGMNTLRCLERLEKVGYTHVCTYENRKSRRVALKDLRLG